jgi:hypothetical protein
MIQESHSKSIEVYILSRPLSSPLSDVKVARKLLIWANCGSRVFRADGQQRLPFVGYDQGEVFVVFVLAERKSSEMGDHTMTRIASGRLDKGTQSIVDFWILSLNQLYISQTSRTHTCPPYHIHNPQIPQTAREVPWLERQKGRSQHSQPSASVPSATSNHLKSYSIPIGRACASSGCVYVLNGVETRETFHDAGSKSCGILHNIVIDAAQCHAWPLTRGSRERPTTLTDAVTVVSLMARYKVAIHIPFISGQVLHRRIFLPLRSILEDCVHIEHLLDLSGAIDCSSGNAWCGQTVWVLDYQSCDRGWCFLWAGRTVTSHAHTAGTLSGTQG